MVPEMLYPVGRKRIIVLRIKAAAEGQGKTIIGLMEETSFAYNTVLLLFSGSVSRIDSKRWMHRVSCCMCNLAT